MAAIEAAVTAAGIATEAPVIGIDDSTVNRPIRHINFKVAHVILLAAIFVCTAIISVCWHCHCHYYIMSLGGPCTFTVGGSICQALDAQLVSREFLLQRWLCKHINCRSFACGISGTKRKCVERLSRCFRTQDHSMYIVSCTYKLEKVAFLRHCIGLCVWKRSLYLLIKQLGRVPVMVTSTVNTFCPPIQVYRYQISGGKIRVTSNDTARTKTSQYCTVSSIVIACGQQMLMGAA